MKLTLKIKPLSVNQYYRSTKSGKRVKTGAGLAYDEELEYLLEDFRKELEAFEVNPLNNILRINIFIYNPQYYTKEGNLRKTMGDVDNTIKILQDKITRMMNIDDYLVRKIWVEDCPSDDWRVDVQFLKYPIPEFRTAHLH